MKSLSDVNYLKWVSEERGVIKRVMWVKYMEWGGDESENSGEWDKWIVWRGWSE